MESSSPKKKHCTQDEEKSVETVDASQQVNVSRDHVVPCEEGRLRSHAEILNMDDLVLEEVAKYMCGADLQFVMNMAPDFQGKFRNKIKTAALAPLSFHIWFPRSDVSAEALLNWRKFNFARPVVDSALTKLNSPQAYYESLTTKGAEWAPNVVDENHSLRSAVKSLRDKFKFNRRPAQLKFEHYLNRVSFPENIFITQSGSFSIAGNILEALVQVNTRTLQILGVYGHALSSVTLHIISDPSMVFDTFAYLPNIKILCIRGRAEMGSFAVAENSLNLLETLNVDGVRIVGGELNFFATHLLQLFGSQLRTLICNHEFLAAWWIRISKFANLRNLRVSGVVLSTSGFLLQLRGLPLEELQLVGSRPIHATFLQTFEPFKKTLTDIKLFFPMRTECTFELMAYEGITLPIKKFSTLIDNIHLECFWQLIRTCDKLHELRLHGTTGVQQTDIERLQQLFVEMRTLNTITISYKFNMLVGVEDNRGQPGRIVITKDKVEEKQFVRKLE